MRAVDVTFAFLVCATVLGLTWFFSYRPRSYIRVFVPRHDWRGAIRAFVHDPNFGPAMRLMALLQLGCVAAAGLTILFLCAR